mgnify:CR=1 FL=1|jgi:D-glycero-alpha-D-manno-heptose-7-phosphate kinase
MIVSSCPLRVSLLGGSTDLEDFIDKYKSGQVINFPVNLYTYVSLNERKDKNFLIQYSSTEKISVKNRKDIKNDVVRVALEYFKIKTPLTITLTADIPSHGSGLASSSSFMISMVKALSTFKNLELSDIEICDISLNLERKFNPLVGRQDPYGCGLKGFKKMFFGKNKLPQITLYDHSFFKKFNLNLVPIGKGRKSTEVLKSLDYDKRKILYDKVNLGNDLIVHSKFDKLNHLVLEGWESKKLTSPLILNDEVKKIENYLKSYNNLEPNCTLSYKLCGAGNGGYMLVISELDSNFNLGIRIDVDFKGIKSWELWK